MNTLRNLPAIIVTLIVAGILIFVAFQIFSGLFSNLNMPGINIEWFLNMSWTSFVFWGFVALIILGMIGEQVPAHLKTLVGILGLFAVVFGIYQGFGDGTSQIFKAASRWSNTGDYSYDTGYVPKYYGGRLILKVGGLPKKIEVMETIEIPVPVGYAFHANPAIFLLRENRSGSLVKATPCDPNIRESSVSLITIARARRLKNIASNNCS